MQVEYDTNKLTTMCEDPKSRRGMWLDDNLWNDLQDAIAVLRSAPNLSDVLHSFRPHPVRFKKQRLYSIDICRQYRVLFSAVGDDIYTNNSIDIRKVTAVRIEFVGDPHPFYN